MCGFVGAVNFVDGIKSVENLKLANNLMISRGPDSEGYFKNSFCQIGFRRLSILDLSDAGNQPMMSSDKRYLCIFNGEIYNYKKIYNEIESKFSWKSRTDTEVLLNAFIYWGNDCVKKFDGMFAFAIIDLEKKTLFCSRDRFGEKPFFYFKKDNFFYFSSTLSSLEKISDIKFDYDHNSINDFINFGHTKSNKTIYNNVNKLTSGTSLFFKENYVKLKQYWKPENLNQNDKSLIEFDTKLKHSVKEKLNSDRPLGVFLSSGIDSSLIAILAKKEINELKTFSIGFKNQKYDESKLSKKFAKYIGSKHYEKIIDENDLLKVILDDNNYFDEPIADPSLIPTLIMTNFAKNNEVDVCLSGDGGDELFGGYNYYNLMKLKLAYLKIPNCISEVITNFFLFSNSHKSILLKKFLLMKDLKSSFLFLKSLKKDFWNVNEMSDLKLDLNEFDNYRSVDPMNNIFNYDMSNNLIDNYLVKLDRSSMLNSLECRLPFLSNDIVNFSLNLNSKEKISFFKKKIFLKKYAKQYLPNFILNKKKRGFEIPIKEWLRNELYRWSSEIINDDNNYSNLPIEKSKVVKLFNIHISKKRDAHPYLWSILMLLKFNRNRLNK